MAKEQPFDFYRGWWELGKIFILPFYFDTIQFLRFFCSTHTHWAFLEVYKTSPDNAVVRGVDCFYPRFWYEIVQQNLMVPKTHTGRTNHICIFFFFFRILHWPTSQMGRFRCGLTLLSWLLPLSVIGKIHFFH